MTLTATTNKVAYAGDGATVSFPVTFIYWDDTGVKVILSNDTTGVETTWVDGTEYTLSGGDGATGTLTVDTSPTDYTPASGETLTIKSNEPDTQTTSLPLGGSLPSTSVEERLDKSVRLTQQLQEELDRTIQFPESSTTTGVSIEDLTALELLRVDSAGTGIEGVSLTDLSLGLGTATKWSFDSSTTMADPGTGDIRLNNATLASVTQIAVDALSAQSGNPDISDWVATWDDSNSAVRGYIMIHEDGTPSNFWVGYVNGAITDNTGWLQIPVTHVDSGGSFAASDSLVVGFSRTGDASTQGVSLLWDSDTTDADSGAGKVWFNNATLASVTTVYVDDVDTNSVNINTFVDSFDDGGSTITGSILVIKKGDSSVYALYDVTGAVTSASTYSKVAVTHVQSNGTFTDADPVDMVFTRAGDKGDTGSTGSTGATGATGSSAGGLHYQFETSITDADQGAGKLWLNNGTVGSATVLYLDDDDNDGVDVSAFTATWDDSTHTALRGYIRFQARDTSTDWALFSITGATTDATAYQKFAVTHIASAGTFSDTEVLDVYFSRTGDDGTGALDNIVEDTTPQLGGALDTNSFAINESEGAAVASATTTDIFGGNDGNTLHITGTTTITDFTDASSVGQWRKIIFDGVLTLTHGSGITLPGSSNITTAAGDYAFVYADTVSAFTVLYFKADGTALVASAAYTGPTFGYDSGSHDMTTNGTLTLNSMGITPDIIWVVAGTSGSSNQNLHTIWWDFTTNVAYWQCRTNPGVMNRHASGTGKFRMYSTASEYDTVTMAQVAGGVSFTFVENSASSAVASIDCHGFAW
jgi:hypothetical protein